MSDDWELIYRDTFDREAPPSTEASGTGLVAGLVELWTHYLFETLQGGQVGFSDFTLYAIKRRINVEGDPGTAERIRTWVDGDRSLLEAIARAHARELAKDDNSDLFLGRKYCVPIFRAAEAASSAADFAAALA